MNRRNFVNVIAAGTVFGTVRAFGQVPTSPGKPAIVRAGQDRGGRRHHIVGGLIAFDAKVATADSSGGLFLWENIMTTQGGPGRHLHHAQDEWFYVLEGEYVVEVGEERHFLHPGDSIFLPREVPHAWAHISEGTGKLLGALQPAGTFEQFVEEFDQAGAQATREQLQALTEKHGMKNMGPPIDLAKLKREE